MMPPRFFTPDILRAIVIILCRHFHFFGFRCAFTFSLLLLVYYFLSLRMPFISACF